MRYLIKTLLGALMISGAVSAGAAYGGNNGMINSNVNAGDTIKVLSSPELNILVNDWIREFSKTQPLVNFKFTDLNAPGVSGPGSLYFLTEGSAEKYTDQLDWQLTIGHNAVVPVTGNKNQMLAELLNRGVTPEEFGAMVTTGLRWSDLIDGGTPEKVKVFVYGDQEIKALISDFTEKGINELNLVFVAGKDELITFLAEDPSAIGFSRLTDLKKTGLNELSGDIVLLPIDKNMNGRIDNFEKIYGTPDELLRGLWIGKYPRSLSGSIYLMSAEKPAGNNKVAFLSWIMNDGGRYFAENGFTDLVSSEKGSVLAALEPTVSQPVSNTGASPNIWITLLLCAVVAGALISLAFRFTVSNKGHVSEAIPAISKGINAGKVLAPGGLFYDKSHTWAFMEKDGLIRIGVDDFLPRITGEITKIILKEPGSAVRRGEKILTLIRDGKQLNLYAPISGTIKALNTDLYLDSSIINSSPYSDGWVYIIEPRNWARELQLMFMSEKYRSWIDEEFIRLKNFFAGTLIPSATLPGSVIMQDGGELRENPLAELDPEVWEEFQTRFIDVSK